MDLHCQINCWNGQSTTPPSNDSGILADHRVMLQIAEGSCCSEVGKIMAHSCIGLLKIDVNALPHKAVDPIDRGPLRKMRQP